MSELLQIDCNSKLQWPGLASSRFLGTRKHLTVPDSIKDFQGKADVLLGRKHYEEKYDIPLKYKPTLKISDKNNKETTKLRGNDMKKHYEFHPSQRKSRAERKHQEKEEISNEFQWKGIKVFERNNKKSEGNWGVEEKMQEKIRIFGLSKQRNLLPLTSLGDKIYKNPEYSSDFFKGSGLIPGSNFFIYKKKVIPGQETKEKMMKIVHFNEKNMTWKMRKAIDERKEDEMGVEELNKWEENILAEANPNWRDPEKVGPPDLFAEREKNGGKDVKKNVDNKKK